MCSKNKPDPVAHFASEARMNAVKALTKLKEAQKLAEEARDKEREAINDLNDAVLGLL